jgi:hypothetical protein
MPRMRLVWLRSRPSRFAPESISVSLCAVGDAWSDAGRWPQDTEVGALHVRVKQTLDTKDATIAQLRAQLAASQQSQRATEEALRSL